MYRAKDYPLEKGKHQHKLIWIKHNGPIPLGYCIHHINGDKKDNRIDNLECLSRKEHGLRHHLPNRKRIVFPSGAVKVIRLAE